MRQYSVSAAIPPQDEAFRAGRQARDCFLDHLAVQAAELGGILLRRFVYRVDDRAIAGPWHQPASVQKLRRAESLPVHSSPIAFRALVLPLAACRTQASRPRPMRRPG